MTFWIKPHLAIFIPIYVITLWLVITTILGFLSGWFRLMRVFPDLPEVASLRLRFQSGAMGPGVAMNGILVLSVCPSGLRVGTMQVFSPFNRDFLVPWQSIVVTRKNFPFWPTAKLQFGNPAMGTLTISAHLADRLARAAMADWPESEPLAD